MPALRIGILAESLEGFQDWELRLLARLAGEETLEIAALILDGREGLTEQKAGGLRAWAFKKVARLDARYFVRERRWQKADLIASLSALPSIKVRPRREGRKDIFEKDDSQALKDLGLDVILQLGFGEIEGEILAAAPFAIWSLFPGDDRFEKTGQPGFRTLIDKAAVSTVTLLVNVGGSEAVRVIARAHFDRQISYAKNRAFLLEKSSALVLREFKRLAITRRLAIDGPAKAYRWEYRAPGLLATGRYCLQLGCAVAGKLFNRFVWRLGVRTLMWAPFLGKLPEDLKDLKQAMAAATEVKPGRNQYWADPFLFRQREELFLFFENFSYAKNRGRISVGRIKGRRLELLGDALVRDYHLSYPFIFKEEGETYMIPETHERQRIELWRARDFPLQWELQATALVGSSVVDTTLLKKEGQWWLFCNIANDSFGDHTSDLHIFRIDGPEMAVIEAHKLNPVVIDSSTARNGGRIFERGGRLFRPSQNNSFGVYGYGLNLMEITELSLTDYREEPYLQITPDFRKGVMACHHFDCSGEDFVVDGRKRFGGF